MSNEEQKQPPQALIDQAEKINDQYLHRSIVYAEVYDQTSYCGQPGQGEWRFRLKLKITKETVVEHLSPDSACGHSYMLLSKGMEVMYNTGKRDGICTVAEKQLNDLLRPFSNISTEDFKQFMETGGTSPRPV